jgi:hypothetical protein
MNDVKVLIEIAQITLAQVAIEFLRAGNDQGALGCLRAHKGLEIAKGYPCAQLSEEDVANLDLAHALGASDLKPGEKGFSESITVLRRIAAVAAAADVVDTADTRELLRLLKWRQAKIERSMGNKSDPATWIASPTAA